MKIEFKCRLIYNYMAGSYMIFKFEDGKYLLVYNPISPWRVKKVQFIKGWGSIARDIIYNGEYILAILPFGDLFIDIRKGEGYFEAINNDK